MCLVFLCPLKNQQDMSPFKHIWADSDAVTSFCPLLNSNVLGYYAYTLPCLSAPSKHSLPLMLAVCTGLLSWGR